MPGEETRAMAEQSEIVDLARYPIAEPASTEARALVAACRKQMAAGGLCLLPGFLRAEALAAMTAEAVALLPAAHHTEHWRASRHGAGDQAAGTIARKTRASIGAIACDRITAASPLRALYKWPALTDFVAAVLGGRPLHRSADPLVACMLTVCRTGDELGWHYDPNDGVVSLLLQDSEAGGDFEFAPGVRDARPDPAAAELAVIEGRAGRLLRPVLAPGTLSLQRPASPAPGGPGHRPATAHHRPVQLRGRDRPHLQRRHPSTILWPSGLNEDETHGGDQSDRRFPR